MGLTHVVGLEVAVNALVHALEANQTPLAVACTTCNTMHLDVGYFA